MTSSEGLEARYSAIIDGIASLKDLQPSYPSARVSRITSSSGGVSGRASPAPGTYQRAPSGRPNSRVDSSASSRNSNLSADVAAINSSQRKAVQPSFTSTVRTKTARPESRDRTSAWAAPLYKAPASAEQQQHSQLDTNSWMPHDVLVQSSRVTVADDLEHASHAMGMTLSQYMSQMPSREAAAGESWARPVSASLTAQDCQPPAGVLQDGLSSVEDDESPGWRDDEHWEYAAAGRHTPSPPGPEDATDLTPGSRHLSSARGNGLDLRPATAAGMSGNQALHDATQDASSTRQTDLGSLSAQLFAPRPQTQGGCFRPPSRRLSRPSSAQRTAARPMSGSSAVHASGSSAAEATGSEPSQGLIIRGGRKVQSARPLERDQRPPSRQKPPPEALHLFQPVHGSSSGGFAPSPVFRTAAAGTARPSTSASIMQQASLPRSKLLGAPVLHPGRMTLDDLQKLSQAAVSNSQALQTQAPVAAGENVPISIAQSRAYARPPSAGSTRPPCVQSPSARPPSARPPSAGSPSVRQ
ncbi:hypothetical protein ABBQ38_004370 [Trebouxia sp. C0009 RCD-2024]